MPLTNTGEIKTLIELREIHSYVLMSYIIQTLVKLKYLSNLVKFFHTYYCDTFCDCLGAVWSLNICTVYIFWERFGVKIYNSAVINTFILTSTSTMTKCFIVLAVRSFDFSYIHLWLLSLSATFWSFSFVGMSLIWLAYCDRQCLLWVCTVNNWGVSKWLQGHW